VVYNNGEQSITISGEDVSGKIRTPEVSKAASLVAAVPEVRLKLVELQRQTAAKQSVVMDGRDIGTYVLPDAEVKIFLTATVAERARRRYEELLDKGMTVSLEEIAKDIEQRDYNDSTRAFAPLKKAEDAVEIDTTALTIDEVVEKVKALAWKRMGKC
jgi:cytidylate kinase